MTLTPDPDDTIADLEQIAGRLALIVSNLQAASGAHDEEAVRLGASELLAEIEPLQRVGRESGKPRLLWYSHHPGGGAGIWLVEASATSMLDELSSSDPDWDRLAAASTYAESGILQLQDAISGRPTETEELRTALAQTIAHVEERLQGQDLAPSTRERLAEQLSVLRDLELK
jgi:hypothetical protein